MGSSQWMHFVEQTGGIWSGSVDALWEYVGNCELLGFREKQYNSMLLQLLFALFFHIFHEI